MVNPITSNALIVGAWDVHQSGGMELEDRVLPEGGGIISLFGIAVLIWSLVIAAAIFLF